MNQSQLTDTQTQNSKVHHKINYHVDDVDLMSYASGNCDESLSLLIATHLTLCQKCRNTVDLLEAVGGRLLDDLSGSDIASADDATTVVKALAQSLDIIEAEQENSASNFDTNAEGQSHSSSLGGDNTAALDTSKFPRVLQPYIGQSIDSQKWKRLLAGVESWQLVNGDSGIKASLMRVDAGRVMPQHTHKGRELTLILDGSMLDRDVVYRRGDVVEADETTRHRPRAGVGDDCVCLAVLEGDVVLTNPLYQMLYRLLPSD